jgi:hypothetical protein
MSLEVLSDQREKTYQSARPGDTGGKQSQPFVRTHALSGFLAMLAIAGVALIRTINLGADAPKGLPTEADYGIYVDEGYKTLWARNMVTFGTGRWHTGDDYSGWLTASPVTQGAFYVGFRVFGQSLEAARIISVMWFALFLIAFGVAYYDHRSSPVFWVGLFMLGFQYVLWVLSRTAIFEIAALSVFYAGLVLLRRFSNNAITSAIVVFAVGVVVTFGIKQNAPAIIAPALLGILAPWVVQKKRVKEFLVVLLVAAVGLFVVSYLQKIGFAVPFGSLLRKTSLFSPGMEVRRFLLNPILEADPFLVILAHACAISVLLYRPKFFDHNSYRAALMSIVFLGTAALATTQNLRLRYCALLLPAFILVVVEWCIAEKQNSWALPGRRAQQISTYAAMLVVCVLAYDLTFLVGWSLTVFPEVGGHTPLLRLPLAGVVAFLCWKKRNVFLSAPVLRTFIFATIVAFALFNSYKVGNSLLRPTWQVRAVSNQLDRILPKGATVAGDWIPLFAIGTNLHVLYTNPVFNQAKRFEDLRPSHFLYCDTDGGKIVKRTIEQSKGVQLGAPLLQSDYIGVQLTLYPLHYKDSQVSAEAETRD